MNPYVHFFSRTPKYRTVVAISDRYTLNILRYNMSSEKKYCSASASSTKCLLLFSSLGNCEDYSIGQTFEWNNLKKKKIDRTVNQSRKGKYRKNGRGKKKLGSMRTITQFKFQELTRKTHSSFKATYALRKLQYDALWFFSFYYWTNLSFWFLKKNTVRNGANFCFYL